MSILAELNQLIEKLKIPIETGEFSSKAPDTYVVLTPLVDVFGFFADNQPLVDVHEVRLSLFSKENYLKQQNQIIFALLQAEFSITSRRFIGFESETKYYHVAIDVAKHYEMEEL